MEALLGSIQPRPSYTSVVELQASLRKELDSKVSPTRAAYISASYDIRTGAIFNIVVPKAEHATLETIAGLNPSQGGLSSGPGAATALDDGEYLHQIQSTDVILSQPQDDPIVQRTVAGHIANSVGDVDGSTWAIKSTTKASQGWTFVYSCKDSLEAWLRARAKTSRPVFGEASGKDSQDPINLCTGRSVKISRRLC